MATPSRYTVVQQLTALADGIEKKIPEQPFVFAGETYDKAELVAAIRALLAAATRVVNAKGELASAIADDKKAQANGAELLRNVRQMIQRMHGNDTNLLAEFALLPVRGRPPPTTEELLLRVTKSLATRKKRRTMGKKQKVLASFHVHGFPEVSRVELRAVA